MRHVMGQLHFTNPLIPLGAEKSGPMTE